MEQMNIPLDDNTAAWLVRALEAHKNSRRAIIGQASFDILFNLGYVLGEAGACEPTSRAYTWKKKEEELERQRKADRKKKK